MSYPISLQALIIEDQEGPKEAYAGIFEALAGEFEHLSFAPAHPCFAFSHQQALEHLESSRIFQVVILDLHLPDKPRMPQAEGIELGLDLLSRCAERERFPIPCLLVISGHVGSTEQARMQDRLHDGFHYGRLLAKGGDYSLLETEIRKACEEAIRYCSVGIHLRDGGYEQYPTITPREEDLLRRSVLLQHGIVGLDLNWWSAKRFPTALRNTTDAAVNTWTKVLMGRYLLKRGEGASRPKFFKLLPGSDAHFVIESARQVEHKLSHIKLAGTVTSRSTALIVTEKVGAQDGRPESLEAFLRRGTKEESSDVARQIAEQVRQLGDLLPTSRLPKTILWPAHDANALKEQWNRLSKDIHEGLRSDADPIQLYEDLRSSQDRQRLNEQSLVHGDLHISNVALDNDHGKPIAYIFDPGVISRNVAGRDLAVLEVSIFLHQDLTIQTLSEICSALYPGTDAQGSVIAGQVTDSLPRNTVEIVRELRKHAEASNDLTIYALMVFDAVLIQAGSLAFGTTGNRIQDERSAIYLLAVVSRWYRMLRKDHKEAVDSDHTSNT
jgi:CheY-like chemotaxis protein